VLFGFLIETCYIDKFEVAVNGFFTSPKHWHTKLQLSILFPDHKVSTQV